MLKDLQEDYLKDLNFPTDFLQIVHYARKGGLNIYNII